MKRLMLYIKPYFGRMTLGFTFKFVGTIMDLFLPWILSYIIDSVVPTKNVPMVVVWGVMMLVCTVVALIGNVVANRMAADVARRTTRKIRHDLFDKILSLSGKQADDVGIPSLVSRLTSDTYNFHQMVNMMQRMGVRGPILILGGILMTITLEPVLALILVMMLPLMGIVVMYIAKKGIPLYTNVQKAVDHMVRTVRENITGVRVIKALSKSNHEKERFSDVNGGLVKEEVRAGMTMAVTNPLMNLLLNIGLTLVILVGAYRVNLGISQPGKIIAFLTYFTIILNAMLSVSRIFMMYSKGSASAERIRAILELPEDLQVQIPAGAPKTEESHLVFDRVHFSYNKKHDDLVDINFSLKRGETLGIIGATGSGKSTIIQLLMRLYDVDSGEIRIDGRDIRTIPSDVLHKKFGVVFQNDTLFADTIHENIDFGRGISDNSIKIAVEDAQAKEFVDELAGGWQYSLAIKGSNLSGGQKQRLLIARALASHPEILILDDSSSALDYKTDARFREALRRDFSDTTTVIVAQRISSILWADRILVLDEGAVIGYGRHEELLNSCESYREISVSQMGEKEAAQ